MSEQPPTGSRPRRSRAQQTEADPTATDQSDQGTQAEQSVEQRQQDQQEVPGGPQTPEAPQDDELDEQGQAPAPEPPKREDLVVNLTDGATSIGPPNMANPDVDKPDDSFDLKANEARAEAEERREPDPTPVDASPVDFFQVASNSGVAVIRFDGHAVLLDKDQVAALSRDLQSAMAGVTY